MLRRNLKTHVTALSKILYFDTYVFEGVSDEKDRKILHAGPAQLTTKRTSE